MTIKNKSKKCIERKLKDRVDKISNLHVRRICNGLRKIGILGVIILAGALGAIILLLVIALFYSYPIFLLVLVPILIYGIGVDEDNKKKKVKK